MENENTQRQISAALYLILGIILILFPTLIGETLCSLISGIFAIMGMVYLAGYFLLNGGYRAGGNPYGWVKGAGFLLLSLLILLARRVILSLIPFTLGLMILAKGILCLQAALNLKSLGAENWKGSMLSSAVLMAFGLVMMLHPFGTAKLISILLGIGLVASGIEDFRLERRVSRQRGMR